MCLFSYYETANQIIMTHNRDESITRGNLASQPILHKVASSVASSNEKVILYPEDIPPQDLNSVDSDFKNILNLQKKGTWWGYETTTGRVAFILNGAAMDEPLYTTQLTSPRLSNLSRGHIIPQLLSNDASLTTYVKNTDWSKFSNFTLFYFDPNLPNQGKLQRLTWNSHRTVIKTIAKPNLLYLSCTLYQPNDKKAVMNLFNQTLSAQTKNKPEATTAAILNSHSICEYQHITSQLDKIKANTKTVSRTQIEFDKSNSNVSIYYKDFNQKKDFTYSNKVLI